MFLFANKDVDECSSPELNNCHVNGNCTDYEGSFTCACNVGYYGDGVDLCNGKLWLESFEMFF